MFIAAPTRICAIMASLFALLILGACQQENTVSGNGANWKVECNGRYSEPCVAAYQSGKQYGSRLAFLGATPIKVSAPVAGGLTIVLPKQHVVSSDLAMQIGDTQVYSYPIGLCDQNICVAKVALSTEQFSALKRAKSMRLSYYNSASGVGPEIAKIDLNGLAAVLDELALRFTKTGWPSAPVDIRN